MNKYCITAIISLSLFSPIAYSEDMLSQQSPGDIFAKPKKQESLLKDSKLNLRESKISLNFNEIDVRALLQIISEHAQRSFIIDDYVSGNISISLNDVSIQQALDTVAALKNLSIKSMQDTLLISEAKAIVRTGCNYNGEFYPIGSSLKINNETRTCIKKNQGDIFDGEIYYVWETPISNILN